MTSKLIKLGSVCLLTVALTACQPPPAPQTSVSSHTEETSTAAETTKSAEMSVLESSTDTSQENAEKAGDPQFQKVRAVIDNIDGRRILVSVDDGEPLKDYAERIYFDLDSQSQSVFQEGDHVEITHDGSFMESDPPIGSMTGINKIP